MLTPPVWLFANKVIGSFISLTKTYIQFGVVKIPYFLEYACESNSVIPYSE